MKLFSTKMHGVLDYLTAGALLAIPRMAGWSKDVTSLMTAMALGTVAYSALTDYELGMMKAIPFKGHLALDGMNGALFCAAPLLFPNEDNTVKNALVGIGLFEIIASLTTETEPQERRSYMYA